MNQRIGNAEVSVLVAPGLGRLARLLSGPSPIASGSASQPAAVPGRSSSQVSIGSAHPEADTPGMKATANESSIPAIPQEFLRAAEQKGYEAGLARGQEAAQRELAAKLGRLDQLLTSIAQKRDDLLEVLEDDIVELALKAAASVVGNSVLSADYPVETIRRILQAHPDAHALCVRIAPADVDLVAAASADGALGLANEVRLMADAEIRLGGCVIETTQGSLDGRIEFQLEKLRAAILDGRSHRSAVSEPNDGPPAEAAVPST